VVLPGVNQPLSFLLLAFTSSVFSSALCIFIKWQCGGGGVEEGWRLSSALQVSGSTLVKVLAPDSWS
jgi:hypothetical protein